MAVTDAAPYTHPKGSLTLVFAIAAVFWYALKSGQFDDLEGPAHRILMDDDRAAPDLGHLAPPHFAVYRRCAHESPAARRQDARSPHSSGSSIGSWQ